MQSWKLEYENPPGILKIILKDTHEKILIMKNEGKIRKSGHNIGDFRTISLSNSYAIWDQNGVRHWDGKIQKINNSDFFFPN